MLKSSNWNFPNGYHVPKFFILARFKLKDGYPYPTLMLIKAGGNDTKNYLGPTEIESIAEFLNVETDMAPPVQEKVRNQRIQ